MSNQTVYLAGKISGLTFDEANTWREHATTYLAKHGIRALNPLRASEYLRDHGVLEGSYEQNAITTRRGIMCRDYYDCTRASLVLANFDGQESSGTLMESAWAWGFRIPLIVVNGPDHIMLREAADYWLSDLDQALHVAAAFLGAYV